MAQTPDEMRVEIEYTRQQLGQMLDELDRSSPGRSDGYRFSAWGAAEPDDRRWSRDWPF